MVAFYAIIHIPRMEQPALVSRIHRWLKPGGRFLATWAIEAWEGKDENWEGWGAPMWWSHYDADANLAMLRDAGFHIEFAERHTAGDETWLWVLTHTYVLPARSRVQRTRKPSFCNGTLIASVAAMAAAFQQALGD
jgi:hypothetical protein